MRGQAGKESKPNAGGDEENGRRSVEPPRRDAKAFARRQGEAMPRGALDHPPPTSPPSLVGPL